MFEWRKKRRNGTRALTASLFNNSAILGSWHSGNFTRDAVTTAQLPKMAELSSKPAVSDLMLQEVLYTLNYSRLVAL